MAPGTLTGTLPVQINFVPVNGRLGQCIAMAVACAAKQGLNADLGQALWFEWKRTVSHGRCKDPKPPSAWVDAANCSA